MLKKAKEGNRPYLDLLLCLHEEILCQLLLKNAATQKEMLSFRRDFQDYARQYFLETFDDQKHLTFAMWISERVKNFFNSKNS
jgi:hypothetical protein